ncbi:unnamed protein product [Timema podura]|uniref:Monocarboxylate transporter n=1 Tax=Timema podura TaxID=61482 RepID=A0ABN7PFW2_TIMPD|nr:unnamed protein product [Timema podura]
MVVGVGLGMAKGVRVVYMGLVIPSYVKIERLASAAGLQMVLNGIFLLMFGPIIGVIRDFTGSYNPCILCMNFLTMLTVIMWVTERIIVTRRHKKQEASKS